MRLSILYRGPLSSCNYGCRYCPFAKHQETAAEHEQDRQTLARFVDWIRARPRDNFSIMFTPWGEALIHRRYQQALIELSNLSQVEKVVIQTNLSGRLDWVDACDKTKMALWTTYHPGEVTREKFLQQCAELLSHDIRFSVGVVGLKEHQREIELLRAALPAEIYLWINAYKDLPDYYQQRDIEQFSQLDPLFPINLKNYQSLNRACRAGAEVISVDGEGIMRRCHFIKTPIGNIYQADFENALRPRLCTLESCDCYIGYVHINDLNLYQLYGNGVLERIPKRKSEEF